jgi:hypothetical protein
MDMNELGYFLYMNRQEQKEESSCDNCKYSEDCPPEYKQEQPNYCENWELA